MNKKDFLKFCLFFYSGMAALSILLIYGLNYTIFLKLTDNILQSIADTATIIFISTSLTFIMLKFKSGQRMLIEFRDMLPDLTIFEKFLVAFMSGTGEELLFRGLLLPITGLTISSFIFGLIHYPLKKHMKIWTFFALIMGFLLGILCELTGSIIFPIAAHILINFIGFNIIQKGILHSSKNESAI